MNSEIRLVKSIVRKGRDYANEPLEASSGEDLNDVVIILYERHGRALFGIGPCDARTVRRSVDCRGVSNGILAVAQ